MPLIETRPFSIVPERYAWPSFRLFSERIFPFYGVGVLILAAVIWGGLRLSPMYAFTFAFIAVAVAVGMSYGKYLSFLKKPENRELFRECRVLLDEEGVRQDYSNGGHLRIEYFAITSFRDMRDFFFIFATKKHAIVVPKSAFSNPDIAHVFAATVKDRMGRR